MNCMRLRKERFIFRRALCPYTVPCMRGVGAGHIAIILKRLLLRGNVIDFLREYDTYTEGAYHHAIIYKESLFILDSLYLCRNLNADEIERIIQKCNEKTN